jgi:ParB-like chromosome segregation protein Spo0J
MPDAQLKYELTDIESLVPYVRNARVHTDAHIAQIAGSIREFGFNIPVLIDSKRNIIAGHGRVMAARKLGMTEIPVVIADHLTDSQRRAFILADNKIHDNSTFDYETLQLEIDELKEAGFELKLAGFEEFELDIQYSENTWDSDIDLGDRDGVNLDGIPCVIRVEVKVDSGDQTRQLIKELLEEKGIEFQIK